MDEKGKISQLEHRLQRRVDELWNGTEPWQVASRQVFSRLREHKLHAVLFGGALRNLFGTTKRKSRPRDVDIVFSGASMDSVALLFPELEVRKNRFGGMRLKGLCIDFDLWPVEETYLLKARGVRQPRFEDLPSTTFLNVEGVAVALWPDCGVRRVFTKNHEFFHAILNRTLELNAEENPFPSLCVVRTLALAYSEGFRLGPRLAWYIAAHGRNLGSEQLAHDQQKHYGYIRISPLVMQYWIGCVSKSVDKCSDQPIELPRYVQQLLFPLDERA